MYYIYIVTIEISSFQATYTYQELVWLNGVSDFMILLYFPTWFQLFISIVYFRILYIIIWI